MKKRFLYAAEVHLPGRKASSIHVMRMCEALANEGYDVRLLALRSPEFQGNEDVFEYYGTQKIFDLKVVQAPGRGRLASFWLGGIAMKEIIRFRPAMAYSRSVVLAFMMSLVAKNMAYEAHTFVFRAARRWHASLFKRLLKMASLRGVVVISEALKKMFVAEGVPDQKIWVAHDGADIVSTHDHLSLMGDFSCNAGYFGSTYKGRGVEVIMELARRLPDIGFHVFGGDKAHLDDEDAPPSNVVFYGFVSPARVHLYRNACDVLLAPYQSDVYVSKKQAFSTSSYMSPLKIFEYMSARKPMIVSDIPVLREVLSEQIAVLVPPNNTDAWSQALIQLCRDAERQEELAGKAYQQFLEQHTWQKRAASIVEWLEKNVQEKV